VNYPSVDEVVEFVKLLFPEQEGDKVGISVRRNGLAYVIKVDRMYDFVPVRLASLLSLAKFFDTLNVNDSRFSQGGCESCDYGSSYEVIITVAEGAKP